MLVFISVYSRLTNIILDRVIQLTIEVHYDQVIQQLTEDMQLLKSTTEKISSNQKIVNLLDQNKSFNELDPEEASMLMDQINLYEQILESFSFVDTVNIVSLSGNYLFSKGHIYNDFLLNERPWYKEEYLYNYNKTYSIVTDIHQDFTSNEDTLAIVSFIYTPDKKELLGAAILDIYIDDLLNNLKSSFDVGLLEPTIIPSSQDVNLHKQNIDKSEYSIRYTENILYNGNGILLAFNKDSIKENSIIKPILTYTSNLIFMIGLAISISLIIIIRLAFFRPALVSIDKLKQLLDTLNVDDTSLTHMDEFDQLKVISSTLGKSFDNKIQSLIYHDTLTGMPNRKKMMHICKALIQDKQPFALAFIDLNKFKKINDVYGHSIGDQYLITFSKIIKNALGNRGELIRYSGDEFIIIYKDFNCDIEFIEFYKNEILPPFTKPIAIQEDVNVSIEFSTGVAVYPRDGVEIEDLINKSDFMMYTSKSDSVPYKLLFFNQDIYKDMLYIEILKTQLKFAIQNNELTLYYQPIFNKDASIAKAEALIRFNNQILGPVPPAKFIPYAEETRAIIPIGYWIIEEVCKFIKEYTIPIRIGINVSPIQLLEPDFLNKTKNILNMYNINLKQIYFEITESVLLDDSEVVSTNIHKLRELGIDIALDDFGTGYASFNYLKKYKLDILKIDKLFLDNASDDDYEIIRHIKKIANLLKMKVVIEGVETAEQFNNLRKIECDFFQGYYFSKPLVSKDLLKLLSTNK